MNILEHATLLKQRGWILLLTAIIVGGGSYIFSSNLPTVYRATQVVLIQPSRADLGLTEASKTLLGNYVAYLDSEYIAQQIIEDLKLDMLASDLKQHVTIAPISINLTIQVDVDLPEANVAKTIAQAWGNKLIAYRNSENQKVARTDQIGANLQDVARVTILSPKPVLTAISGIVLGLILGLIIILILENYERSFIRSSNDLEKLDIDIMGVIPHQ